MADLRFETLNVYDQPTMMTGDDVTFISIMTSEYGSLSGGIGRKEGRITVFHRFRGGLEIDVGFEIAQSEDTYVMKRVFDVSGGSSDVTRVLGDLIKTYSNSMFHFSVDPPQLLEDLTD